MTDNFPISTPKVEKVPEKPKVSDCTLIINYLNGSTNKLLLEPEVATSIMLSYSQYLDSRAPDKKQPMKSIMIRSAQSSDIYIVIDPTQVITMYVLEAFEQS